MQTASLMPQVTISNNLNQLGIWHEQPHRHIVFIPTTKYLLPGWLQSNWLCHFNVPTPRLMSPAHFGNFSVDLINPKLATPPLLRHHHQLFRWRWLGPFYAAAFRVGKNTFTLGHLRARASCSSHPAASHGGESGSILVWSGGWESFRKNSLFRGAVMGRVR